MAQIAQPVVKSRKIFIFVKRIHQNVPYQAGGTPGNLFSEKNREISIFSRIGILIEMSLNFKNSRMLKVGLRWTLGIKPVSFIHPLGWATPLD